MSRLRHVLFALVCLVGMSTVARAQVIAEQAPPLFPDPSKFSRGFYAQGEVGALAFAGHAGRFAGPGPAFGVRLGYDILRWLSVQAHVMGASGNALLAGPTDGQAFQTLIYGGEAHLQAQIRRVGLFAEAGAAAAQIPTNVLDNAGITEGKHVSLAVIAGGGIDVHTLNRHFSFGAAADYLWLASFNKSSAVSATAFIKYTR